MRLNSTWVNFMAVISVPKTPKKAYDPRRPAGTLLQNQIRHLEWAVRPAGKRMPKAFKKIKPAKTEARPKDCSKGGVGCPPTDRRQYYDQRTARYYYFDSQTGRYYWESGEPRF